MQRPVIIWDGKNLPEGLREVPPGRYLLEAMQDVAALSAEEEHGIQEALKELEAGKGRSLADVLFEIRGRAPRK
jgi:hypothetical protein